MPNHLHGIMVITDPDGGVDQGRDGSRTVPARRKSVGRLVGAFKTVSTKRHQRTARYVSAVVWQRNYCEHIICGAASLARIRRYIATNPSRWSIDRENRGY
ncbi:MAG: hypothetical protein J7464_06800 [Chloroflexus sp.]|nr:hypothetical protein [Chloroflexus sp.]